MNNVGMRLHQRVSLQNLDDEPGVEYVTSIEGLSAHHLLLAVPLVQGAPLLLRLGTRLRVTLYHPGGAHAFDTEIVERVAGEVPSYQIDRPSRLIAIQRRKYFREAAVVEACCSTAPDAPEKIDALTRNLGGGGVLLRTRQTAVLRAWLEQREESQPVWLELRLPGEPLAARAEVVWLFVDDDNAAADLALEFVDLPDAERERLIRYLFMLQREALKKGC